jgi:curved DNA-binding protein CbpA
MNIDQGLFKFDFMDYHAILGVPLDADAKQVRKRYLKIARKLHPDSLSAASDTQKQQASELLSKMVNPAYEKLSQEKDSTEHKVVLRMRGQQLSQQRATVQFETEGAKKIAAANNADQHYNAELSALVDQQYESLDNVLVVIGQISELNMAYLMQTAGSSAPAGSAAAPPTAPAPAGSSAPSVTPQAPPPPPSPRQQRASIIDSYLNRAREFEQKQDFSRGIMELREAVKSHPNNAPCHSYLAKLYLQAGQATMAGIHIKRALDIDPNDPLAQAIQPRVNATKKTESNAKAQAAKSKGGLFGLFGGKQK